MPAKGKFKNSPRRTRRRLIVEEKPYINSDDIVSKSEESIIKQADATESIATDGNIKIEGEAVDNEAILSQDAELSIVVEEEEVKMEDVVVAANPVSVEKTLE
jgi:exopolysaccharide biosynthesis protein